MTCASPESVTANTTASLDKLVEAIARQRIIQGDGSFEKMASHGATEARIASDLSKVYATAARLAEQGIYISVGDVDRANGGKLIPVTAQLGRDTIFLFNIDCGNASILSEGSLRGISEDDLAKLIEIKMQEAHLLPTE